MLGAEQFDANSLVWMLGLGMLFWQVRSLILRKRSREMFKLGEELDVEFNRLHNDEAARCLHGTKFGARYPHGQICNTLGCEVAETRLMVFDYHYYVRSYGRRRNQYRQTITTLLPTRTNFPDFQLRPEGLIEKMGAWMGMQDIDFPEHEGFSSQYVLQADHERFIRQFFDAEILDFFAQHPGWWIESTRRGLIIYKKRTVLSAEEIKKSMTLAVQLFELVETQGARLLSHELSEAKGLSCTGWLPEAMAQPSS